MITTVRSAKAVITTFCRMFSCGDGGREVSLSKHAFIFTGIQSLCKNKRCFRLLTSSFMLFKKKKITFSPLLFKPSSLVHCLVPSYRLNRVSLRAVLLPYCKLELALFVANRIKERLLSTEQPFPEIPLRLSVCSVFSFYFRFSLGTSCMFSPTLFLLACKKHQLKVYSCTLHVTHVV